LTRHSANQAQSWNFHLQTPRILPGVQHCYESVSILIVRPEMPALRIRLPSPLADTAVAADLLVGDPVALVAREIAYDSSYVTRLSNSERRALSENFLEFLG
jgi:hypothetical protein